MKADAVFVANAARYDRFEDMAKMGELNEACVMDNLKRRYTSNLIYVKEKRLLTSPLSTNLCF